MPNHRALALVTGALLAIAGASALPACTGATPPAMDPSPPAAPVALPTTDAAVPASMPLSPSPAPTPITAAPTPSAAAPSASPTTAATASPAATGVFLRAHVAPILAQHCKACHVTGGSAPFAMFDAAGNPLADTVKSRFAAMLTAIEAGRMPMGKPNSVPAAQLAVLKAWQSAGMPLDPVPAGASPSPAATSPAPTVPTDATVSFETHVEPILRNRCSGCHTVGSGGGAREVAMFNRAGQVQYWEIAKEIDDIIEAIEDGEMPKGAPPGTVKPSELDTLRAWYRAGTPNN
jgi:mono/diheme cytochrome c family protein